MGKSILVLGGGVGGLVVSNLLRKKLGKEHRIILVDKKAKHEFTPSYVWLMLGWREPQQVTRDLNRLSRKGIEYVNAEVLKIDPSNRTVKTSTQDYSYDYLVITLGAELAPDVVPGFSKSAHHVYNLEAAIKFRDMIGGFSEGTVAMGISSLPFKCPAAPYESALLLDYHFRKIGIRDKVDIKFFTPEPLPMPVAGPVVGNMVKQLLEGRNISFNPTIKLASVDENKKEIIFENGEKMKFNLLFAVPPHRSPKVVKDTDLVNETGWVPVDKKTLKTRYDDVYALGDVTAIKLPIGMMLPKAGVFAHNEAKIVADNIAAEIEGTEARKEFSGDGGCWIETGYGKAGYASGNFYAEPAPAIKARKPSRIWHWTKIMFEKYWLWHWF